MAQYKVTFLGLAVAGPEEEARLLKGLQKRFHLTPERAESLLHRVPIVVKKGIPKEEMERYVRAFEEIGARIRVEEEPEPEPLRIEEPPRPQTQPFLGRMITCPKCGFEQPETGQCIQCGVIFATCGEGQEKLPGEEARVRETPCEEEVPSWESGEGFIAAFLKTSREVLFSPASFFKKVANGSGYWPPLLYGLITGIIGMGATLVWLWLIVGQFIRIEKFLPLHSSSYLLGMLIPLPFQYALNLLVESAVTHLCLMVVGGNKNGYRTTFRAIAYSFGGYLFGMIPLIGMVIGGLYQVVLVIVGIREGHGISTGRAVLAVLFPLILVVGLGIIVAIFLPLIFGSIGFLGGVRI